MASTCVATGIGTSADVVAVDAVAVAAAASAVVVMAVVAGAVASSLLLSFRAVAVAVTVSLNCITRAPSSSLQIEKTIILMQQRTNITVDNLVCPHALTKPKHSS